MTGSLPLSPDVDRIADFPWEVLEYLGWLRRQPTGAAAGGYLFDEPRVRFTALGSDLLVSERDVRVDVDGGHVRLTAPRIAGPVILDGVGASSRDLVARLLSELDGQRPLASVRSGLSPDSARVLDALLDEAFGKLIFAPLALLASERAISGIEITRFPGSPYEIARPYWANMAAVRARSSALFASLDDDARFVRELRRLHVIALMGDDLQTYYRPASPISSGRAAPGRFMLTRTEVVDTSAGSLILSGPRVNAGPVGGARYHELLDRSLAEPEAALTRRHAGSADLDWGRVVHGRAAEDAADAFWFCPPRPLQRAHFKALREALLAAERAVDASDRVACLQSLAAFHQYFIRLHPFHCGNQSLAMNIVNHVAQRGMGAGLPHLILDHLALRLSPAPYARAFARAVAAHLDPQANAAARYLRAAANRAKSFELTRKLEASTSLDEAAALLDADPRGAELLLLKDP